MAWPKFLSDLSFSKRTQSLNSSKLCDLPIRSRISKFVWIWNKTELASWKREEKKLHLQEMMAHLEQMASGVGEGAGVDVHQVEILKAHLPHLCEIEFSFLQTWVASDADRWVFASKDGWVRQVTLGTHHLWQRRILIKSTSVLLCKCLNRGLMTRKSSPWCSREEKKHHVSWSTLTPWTPACSMQFLTSCRLWMLPFAITGTCKTLIVGCGDLEGEENAPSQHPWLP